MKSIKISETGVARSAFMLHELARKATHQYDTMAVSARETERGVRGIPHRTGRLERSVGVVDVTNDGFVVGASAPYAGFVFNGTKHMAANPPHVPEIAGRVATAISNDIA